MIWYSGSQKHSTAFQKGATNCPGSVREDESHALNALSGTAPESDPEPEPEDVARAEPERGPESAAR